MSNLTNKKPNHLINETSPYLLQHAFNPVEWFPWGEEALSKAKKENKPILVSIGYAACHWCHVMEKESFENEETASLMNSHFVNIKIDREERPDLDHLYMDAVQTMTGSGGWPLNVFLTTDQKPFYGGTYFPPVPAHGRASWENVLTSLADAWTKRQDEIKTQASTLISHLQKAGNFTSSINIVADEGFVFSKDNCREMAVNLLATADTTDGGFGAAPKFLHTPSITYLLQHAHFFNNSEALAQAELSLKKMLQGGIYDQVGGGISRYSTDSYWLVPHFEKMLYDNALLLSALSEAFQLTKDKEYKSKILHIFSFLLREMKDTKGGFYAALDADSDGVEGKFYIWKKQELETLLAEDCDLYSRFYNVLEKGNIPPEHTAWKDENILHITASANELAPNVGHSVEAFEKKIINANNILLGERKKRIRPQTDTKIILAWNALVITSFCKCFAATGEKAFLDEAINLQKFIENNFKDESSFYGHAVTNSRLKNPAFLDDLSFYIQACIALQEVTGNEYYLNKAKVLTEYVCDHFNDEENIFFYFTSDLQSDIILRKKEIHDGAMPSANGIMLSSLLYLSIVFDNLSWSVRAKKMLQILEKAIFRHPSSFAEWAKVYQLQSVGINEIAVTGKDFAKLLQLIGEELIPNKIIQATSSESDMPLLKGKNTNENTLIFVCRNYSCKAPVERVAEMIELLKN